MSDLWATIQLLSGGVILLLSVISSANFAGQISYHLGKVGYVFATGRPYLEIISEQLENLTHYVAALVYLILFIIAVRIIQAVFRHLKTLGKAHFV